MSTALENAKPVPPRVKPAVANAVLSERVPAEECVDMDEVRAAIDAIDRELVQMIAERTAYIEAAARIKPREDEVRLEWRIEDVVAKVLAAADAAGLPADIAEPVWRLLIERSIAHEMQEWRRLRESPSD